MKKILSLLLTVCMLLPLVLTSCGGGDDSSSSSSSEDSSSSSQQKPTPSAPEIYKGDGEKVIYADANNADVTGYVGDGSSDMPYATLPEAYAAAVAYSSANEECPVTVYLRQGTYILSKPLQISAQLPIKICGNTNMKKGATVTTAKEIPFSEFEAYGQKGDVTLYKYQLPASAKDKHGNYPEFRDLYLDRVSLTLSGTEKGGVFAYDTCAHASEYGPGVAIPATDRLLYVDPSFTKNIKTDAQGFIINEKGDRTTLELWIRVEWQIHCIRAERVAENALNLKQGSTKLTAIQIIEEDWDLFKVSGTYYKTLQGRTYWFRNDLAHMDHDGEFYYDQEGGLIYFASNEDLTNSVISYPQADAIFDLSDSKGITIENLTFYGATENFITDYGYIAGQAGHIKTKVNDKEVGFLSVGALRATNTADLTIYGCAISNVGADAINFRGAVDNVMISNCTITDIGGSALRFGEANDSYTRTYHNCDINIINNYLEHIGTVFISNPSIVISSVKNLVLDSNTILDSAYSAISVGFHWGGYYGKDSRVYDANNEFTFVNVKNAEIAYNYIQDFMMRMSDGGAIYTLGGNATEKVKTYLNSVHDNYMVMDDRIAEGKKGFTGVYHDEGSSHWEDYNNVVVLQSGMHLPVSDYFAQQTAGDGVYNNTTYDCFVVGYPFSTEGGVTGHYVFGSAAGFKTTKIAQNRSYILDGSGANGAIAGTGDTQRRDVYGKNIAILATFDDANETQLEALCAIYESSGCDFMDKPLDAMEQPDAPY